MSLVGQNQKAEHSPQHDLLVRYLEHGADHNLIVVDQKNVLSDPSEPAVGSNQVIQLMAKAFYRLTSRRPVDPNWDKRGRDVQQYELNVKRLDVEFGKRVDELFAKAKEAKKWRGTSAMHDQAAYWSHGVLAWFDAAGHDAPPRDAPFPIRTREQLKSYDPGLYDLVREVMAYEDHVDWRLSPFALQE